MKTKFGNSNSIAFHHAQINSVLTKVRNGISLYEVAGDLGISIGEASDRMDDELKNEVKKRELLDKKEIIQLHNSEATNEEIARQLNVPLIFVNKTIMVHDAKKQVMEEGGK